LIELSKKAVSRGFLTREMVRLLVNRIDIFETGDMYVHNEGTDKCEYITESLNTEGVIVVDFKLKKI